MIWYELCNKCNLIVRLQINRLSFDNECVLCQHMCTLVWSVIIIINGNNYLSISYKMFDLLTPFLWLTCALWPCLDRYKGCLWALSAEMKGAAPDFDQLVAMFHQGEHQYEEVNEVRLCLTFLMSQRQADIYLLVCQNYGCHHKF